MYRSFSGLPKRVLCDANLLLDAAFVGDSVAGLAISAVRQLGFSAVVDEISWREATRTVSRYTSYAPPGLDVHALFERRVADFGVVSLPPAPVVYRGLEAVKPHDRHLGYAAKHYGAWVLTSDLELILGLREAGLEGRLPWDARFAELSSRAPPLHYLIRVARPGRERGQIFARVRPGAWANSEAAGPFTVCHIERLGKLVYDNARKGWLFVLSSGEHVFLAADVSRGEEWVVSANYRLDVSSAQLRLVASAAEGNKEVQSHTIPYPVATAPSPGKVSFGHSVEGVDHWNGHLALVVLGPVPLRARISRTRWCTIASTPGGAPNPFTADIVRRALQATRMDPSGAIILPCQCDLT